MGALAVFAGLLLAPIASADASSTTLYHELYRPQFHYTPAQNWMNDPNGLIYYKGEYNLFYQYNPSGNTWGNISWGHAISKDLVHWKQLPVAIPQDNNEYVFSGSVVYDRDNTSRLGTAQNPPLVAVYTSTQKATGIQEQALAYSTDGGLTWTKYAGNPVLNINSQNFRDPKVFWYAPRHQWLMVVARSDLHKVEFYSSPNLKHWTYLSDFGPAGAIGGLWECPDLFPLRVDRTHETKWVLVVNVNPGAVAGGSGTQYFVGRFDGTHFISDEPVTYTPPAGVVLNDFEGSSYGAGWTTTGAAFGTGPAQGTLPGQQTVTGYLGHGLVNSFLNGDGSTGTLTSPAFTISKPYVNFLIGGGDHPYVPGGVLYGTAPPGTVFANFEGSTWGSGWTATGDFANAGPTKESLPGQIDSQALDTCVATCDPAEGTITSQTFTINSNYIDFLIAGGDHPMSQPNPTALNLLINGQVVDTATGNNSGDMDWVSWDVSKYKGQQATIQVVDENDGSSGWGHIILDDIVFSPTAAAPYNTETGVNLLVDGEVVRTATGQNSEALDWTSWDVRDLLGKQAQIQFVDDNTGGWGHLNADELMFADAPALTGIQRAHWVDYGADHYASNTFNDVPGGRRIEIAWMNNWNYGGNIPTSPWRSADTFPREQSLQTIDGHVRLVQQPVSQIDSLHSGAPFRAHHQTVTNGTEALGLQGETLDLQADLRAGSATRFGLNVRVGAGQFTQIGYDTTTHEVYIDRTNSGDVSFDPTFSGVQTAPLALHHGQLRLRILVDASSVEVFADRGEVVLTDQIFPDAASTGVSVFADGGTASLTHLTGWHLRSIWP
ncbi:MAG TPA: GH32 C-terminal domain-containing protein [Solirubrobacteraceae bacterium]|nr:GH32 C-terminal domain-containing protein [Solirubrobacteraceae bacterium]